MYSGGFAVVMPFIVDNEKWAFRCWYNDIGNIEQHLNILSGELKKIGLPYFCEFSYDPAGLLCVNGKTMPTTRMKWIDGDNIKDFICSHKNDAKSLSMLADKFLAMCKDLHKFHIAHGDLQHGNILVNKNMDLVLIDYDSMFIPALSDEEDNIKGLPAYQHPKRGNNEFRNYKLDYFSELIIYLSILAIAEKPSLVDKYQVPDSEGMLFSKEDFINFKNSNIYEDLSGMSKRIQDLLHILECYLQKDDISEFGPFDFMADLFSKHINYADKQFCMHCGLSIDVNEDNLFCINCGNSLFDYKL